MAKTSMIRARMEPQLKEDVEEIFETLGLSMTDALTLFFKQVQLQRRIPFELAVDVKDRPKIVREESIDYEVHPSLNKMLQENPELSLEERSVFAWLDAERKRKQAQSADPYARLRKIVANSPLLNNVDLEELLTVEEARAYFEDSNWYAGAWSDMTPEQLQLFERNTSSKRREKLDDLFQIELRQ